MLALNWILYTIGYVSIPNTCDSPTYEILMNYKISSSNTASLNLIIGVCSFFFKIVIWIACIEFSQDSNPASNIPVNYQSLNYNWFNLFIKAGIILCTSIGKYSSLPSLLYLIAISFYLGFKFCQIPSIFAYLFYIDLIGKVALFFCYINYFYTLFFGDSQSFIISTIMLLPFCLFSLIFFFRNRRQNILQCATLTQIENEALGGCLIYEMCENLQNISIFI